MPISSRQNKEFTDAIMPTYPLDVAVDWINQNMEPSEVFTEDKLEEWAKSQGFEREK